MIRLGRYRFSPPLWATLGCALGCALLAGLGVWQLQRAAYKQGLFDRYRERAHAQPIALPAQADSLTELRYRHVAVTGRMDSGHQFLLDNRTHEGVAGYDVLTPLRMQGRGDDGGAAILVDRGWVPWGGDRSKLPVVPAPEETLRITGILDQAPRTLLLGAAGYETGGWPRVVEEVQFGPMERLLGYRLRPFLLLMDPSQAAGYVREWRPNPGFGPERHRGYALQWFTLAATLFVIYIVANSTPAEGTEARNDQ